MSGKFTAYRIHKSAAGVAARFEELALEDLSPGAVLIKTEYSSVNYKDALAATGKGRILRRFPLVGGIDAAGTVVSSADRRFKKGDQVALTECGLSEDYDGGYAQYLRAQADWVVKLPRGISTRSAMMLGTAGFTAALAVMRLEHNGLSPKGGPVVVTGASGGVGSFAVNLLAQRGYEVVAVTGKRDAQDYLRQLGAATILLRQQINYAVKPLERARWQGAVDSVGGAMLAWLLAATRWGGSVASIGLAGGTELHTTVMPFILRGVNLLGINSRTPRALRLKVWQRLAIDLKPAKLKRIAATELAFDELPAAFDRVLSGQHQGRILVKIA
ncbi:MAG: oxidoreductase [Gammaproteobacteria bacterium]